MDNRSINTLVRAFLALCLVGSIGSTATAQLEGTYEVAIKKQEEKKSARWSLADWLVQKDKNKMMDLWLAQNSHSSLYEFFLEANSINYGQSAGQGTPSTNRSSYNGALAAYAGVVGLRGGYQSDNENRTGWQGSLNVRLLGRAMQDSHVNLEYGIAELTLGSAGSESFQNQFGGGSLNLYLTKRFGIEGVYHHVLPATSDQTKRTMEGENEAAGVFIDFGILRVFGQWKKEFLKFDGGGQSSTVEFREGYGGGLRLYF
jgi:hypothetical protein